MTCSELFRSEDLLVRQVTPHGSPCCVVTFDSFTDFRTLDRPGFGEAVLHAAGIDAVHVLSRENDWYHYPEMGDAMAHVASITRTYPRIVAYGSSMGAYAAIRFGGIAGAHAILALSPQYSIDPFVMPWERRWAECGRRFHPRWERTLPFPDIAEAYVVYDPENVDSRHIARLAAQFRFDPLPIGFGGHPITGFLVDVGLLKPLLLDVCHGSFDKDAFLRRALDRRPHSAQYLVNVAEQLPNRRRAQRLALMRQAMTLAPDDPAVICRLAVQLRFARQFDEALSLHRHALDLMPGHPFLLLNYSITLEKSGNSAAALQVMEDLDDRTGRTAIYRPRLLALRRKLTSTTKPGVGTCPG